MNNVPDEFKSIPGMQNQDDLEIFARRHWVSFLGQFFLSFLMLFLPALLIAIFYFTRRAMFSGVTLNVLVILGGIYYLIALSFCFAAWISYYYDLYILTNDSLVDITQEGFFGRKTSRLSLLRVQDVSSSCKGILQTMFQFGDVLIETAGEHSQNFSLKAVPNPQVFASKVMELHDALIEREGRGGQAVQGEGTFVPKKPVENLPTPPTPPSPTETLSQETLAKKSVPTYQDLLKKDIEQQQSATRGSAASGGEISKDDLNKGGEVKL